MRWFKFDIKRIGSDEVRRELTRAYSLAEAWKKLNRMYPRYSHCIKVDHKFYNA
jgi:hypothetical protein